MAMLLGAIRLISSLRRLPYSLLSVSYQCGCLGVGWVLVHGVKHGERGNAGVLG